MNYVVILCYFYLLQLMKRANKRKETEPDFEEKRFNLSLEEEKEFNKENDRTRSYPKDPYYDNM